MVSRLIPWFTVIQNPNRIWTVDIIVYAQLFINFSSQKFNANIKWKYNDFHVNIMFISCVFLKIQKSHVFIFLRWESDLPRDSQSFFSNSETKNHKKNQL